MSEAEIIKVSSKGQVTIPSRFREELSLDRDSYLYVARAGRILVMKKVDELSLDDVSTLLGAVAREKGLTRELLLEEAKRARRQLMAERDGEA